MMGIPVLIFVALYPYPLMWLILERFAIAFYLSFLNSSNFLCKWTIFWILSHSHQCLAIESIEWNYQLDKLRQKSPSTIGLLSEKQCLDLEVDGVCISSLLLSLHICWNMVTFGIHIALSLVYHGREQQKHIWKFKIWNTKIFHIIPSLRAC